MGLASEILDGAADGDRNVWIETGQIVALPSPSNGSVDVNIGGNVLTLQTMSVVRLGDLVRVLRSRVGTQPIILGRVTQGAVTGTVTAVAAGVSVTVLGDDTVSYTSLPYLTSAYPSPAIGDLVWISWDGPRIGPVVVGKLSSVAGTGDPSVIPPVPPKPPTSAPTSGTFNQPALQSGTFSGSSWWTDKVYFGQSNPYGAWFYGTSVYDTLHGATALPGAQIYLPVEVASGASLTQFGWHLQASKPAGAMAVAGGRSDIRADGTGWWPLDTDLAQYLIDNRGGGIAVFGSGYRIFSGVANADSGRLLIPWKKG